MTLDDLEWFVSVCIFSEPATKKQMQTHTIRYVRIFALVPRTGAPNDSGVLENDILSHFVSPYYYYTL